MMRFALLFFAAAFLLLSCSHGNQEPDDDLPHIIVILADDFGVGDIQAHYPNNKIPTHHLDELAEQGMSFTDAHSSSAVCTPTRYGLLTGRYNWRTPLQEWVIACYEPPLIQEERTTLPEMLKANGYATACIGKWHLGWNWAGEHPSERIEEKNGLNRYEWDYRKPIRGGPTAHGFDYYFGVDLPNLPPFTFIENERVVELPSASYSYEPNPEFVVMPRGFEGSPMAPGWRFEQILPEITKKAIQYIHSSSESDQPFFLFFSMTSPHEPVVPSEGFAGKSGIAPIADFVMETDWSVGQILDAVEKAGISGNTMIVFTADNGHSHYTGWDALLEAGHLPSGPYRGHKADIWEGGHRVPLIVKWEDQIDGASFSDQLICLTDLYATFHELMTGKPPPPDAGEDSFSFLKVLRGDRQTGSRNSIVHHSRDGEFAYRRDGWKIVFKLPEKELDSCRGEAAEVELYHLRYDIEEQFDSAAFYQEKVKLLTGELERLVERGTSRSGERQANDVIVRFDTIQQVRWAPLISTGER